MVFTKSKKKVEEKITEPAILKRYVATRNVEAMKKKGWKEVKSDLKDLGLSEAARKTALNRSDIVYMEKRV